MDRKSIRKFITTVFPSKLGNGFALVFINYHQENDKYFLDNLSLILNKLTCQFDNITLMVDFNLTIENENLDVFMSAFDMDCLIKKPTCFQSVKPNFIDLILTNKKESFKNQMLKRLEYLIIILSLLQH